MAPAETATVVVTSSTDRTAIARAVGRFDVALIGDPPYRVFAEGPNWVTGIVEAPDAREPVYIPRSIRQKKVQPGELGVVWRFSSPAGVFFMEKETTVSEFDACVAGGACRPRNEPLEHAGYPRCSRATTGAADCVTHENAESFCSFLGGRLPTREEWTLEYTNAGRRSYPWGEDPPSCDYANIAIGQADGRISVFSPPGIQVCAGPRTLEGCSYGAGVSVSGLCDMSGNLGEWVLLPPSAPPCALGVPALPHDDLYPRCTHLRSGYIGVRCVRDLERISPALAPETSSASE